TQTDRKIAEELRRTYDAQRESQVRRQDLERETAIANMQADVVRSEQEVRIAERKAQSNAEFAKGEAAAVRLRAAAEADATRSRWGAGSWTIAAAGREVARPAKLWQRQGGVLGGRRRVAMKRERQRRERGEAEDQRFAGVAREELREAGEAERQPQQQRPSGA